MRYGRYLDCRERSVIIGRERPYEIEQIGVFIGWTSVHITGIEKHTQKEKTLLMLDRDAACEMARVILGKGWDDEGGWKDTEP